MAKKVVLNEMECEGCQSCVEVCPEVFGFNEDTEKAYIIDPNGPEDCIEEAINMCPVECIRWEEE